ncbi:DnaJ C-terminal domain-containing protein [Sphingorhabdus arenilitoris]|uniref:DnaJ C-terminal domain-containing protein n=1 Tax=Sphingorhabdus arenilitoris TaxID=1490041 RepID=A0ABV8RDQ0_9SPHN
MTDPYSILGVSKGADEKAIKSAYRKLAKELHPDKNKDNKAASDRFSQVTQAYDLLSDKEKRAQYDRGEIDGDGNPRGPFGGGFGGGGPQGGFGGFGGQAGGVDLGDIFEGLFGGGGAARSGPQGSFGGRPSAPPPKGANIAYNHLVSFTDAATLTPQRITLSDGKTVEFKLPPGIVAGQQIRIPGKGQAGPGGNGDAMVTIKIGAHPDFVRDGDNIRMNLPISLAQAVNGGKVKVPTVDGAVMLTVPPATNSGTTLRITGRGFTGKNGQRGNQLVTLMIHLPTDQAELKKLSEMLSANISAGSKSGA